MVYDETNARATRELLERELRVAIARMVPEDRSASNEALAQRRRLTDVVDRVGGLDRCRQLLSPDGKQSEAFTFLEAAHAIAADTGRPFERKELARSLGDGWKPSIYHALDSPTPFERALEHAYGGCLPIMDESVWIQSNFGALDRLEVANDIAAAGSELSSTLPPVDKDQLASVAPLLAAQSALGEAYLKAPKHELEPERTPHPLGDLVAGRLFGWGVLGGVGALFAVAVAPPLAAAVAGFAVLAAGLHVGGPVSEEKALRASARNRHQATRERRLADQNELRSARTAMTDLVTKQTGLPKFPQLKPQPDGRAR